jgi:hypothetical protein
MKVLLASGFFESQLPSFREYSYAKELATLGHEVTLMCGDQSYIWSRSRVRLETTQPDACDADFCAATGVQLLRRRVFLRVSDFVLYLPVLRAIRDADVVHVIEFRQGVTLVVALLARMLGKPVVYDHEQRGDRTARWYSRVDSYFRRGLIFAGAFMIDCVRHTVLANRDHFRSCTPRRVEEMFAPLGTDPARFFHNAEERQRTRASLEIKPAEFVAVMSGKLHADKKVAEVVSACRQAGIRLILMGSRTADVDAALAALPEGSEILLPAANAEGLRKVYNAADIAIFTTFTVSYWEAYATGLRLVVPASEFTQYVFDRDPHVTLFGEPAMFRVPDESYRENFDVVSALARVLRQLPRQSPTERVSLMKFSAIEQGRRLSELYRCLTDRRGGVVVRRC